MTILLKGNVMCKNMIIIVLVLMLSVSMVHVGRAATRDSLYRAFGPMLLEAVVMVIKDEINILRAQHGLEARTNAQLITALDAKLKTVEGYDWMSEPNSP